MLFASGAAQALAGQLDTMRVVDQAVQDGVGVGGIANDFMPGGQRELGGDDRRSAGVSLFEDFEQIMTGAGVEGFEAEVVENEQIGATKGFDEARMAHIASGERQVLAELRPAMIEDGAIVAAGFLADGAGQPAFADAGRTNDILPKNTSSMSSLNIRIIRSPEGGSWRFGVLFMRAWSIL